MTVPTSAPPHLYQRGVCSGGGMGHLEEDKKAVQVVDAALADRGAGDAPPKAGEKNKNAFNTVQYINKYRYV